MTCGSAYGNVVVEKLRIKGSALDAKAFGISKNKMTKRKNKELCSFRRSAAGTESMLVTNAGEGIGEVAAMEGEAQASVFDRLTPAERQFLLQREKIEKERLAKMASKSHRDQIQEFNKYLANLSEHHDIPKVGPG
ncbi:hypothetical protein MLD38_005986 [Melastoma candidum]|uniref:Uncharacterized protein n=1 Tax=Melastoma candidum TaxID=119954 RepID=A0ACB9RQ62_9MYRT|nr:hypothetical protein MLD38_005986 [Melastoma candidum]